MFIFDNNQLTNIVNQSESTQKNTYTFSGISLFRADFFKDKNAMPALKLGPMLKSAVSDGTVSASILDCAWTDVGTPERLAYLNR